MRPVERDLSFTMPVMLGDLGCSDYYNLLSVSGWDKDQDKGILTYIPINKGTKGFAELEGQNRQNLKTDITTTKDIKDLNVRCCYHLSRTTTWIRGCDQ